MSNLAYIFPGQGSQYVGMGKDLFEQNEQARVMFMQADKLLGISLSKICFEGPEEELRQTKNTQPAIFLHSVILSKLLDEQNVSMVAGHSLGEYSALVYAGALSFEDGLKIVRLRGELMQRAGELQPGTMAAVVGLESNILESVCTEASAEGIVQCANFNSPGQIVISGSVAGVKKAMELAKVRGAKLVKELVVSGAFHSPLMEYAVEGLSKALDAITINDATIPVYANVTAKPVTKATEIRQLLKDQLTKPVRWEESMKNMVADGVKKFVEVGPGKVLQGLVKRIGASVEVSGVDKILDA
ncbi:MAG: ACP S-malonyltransferase [Ignavibacteriales bacterium]|nr:ACP S-malonyltransferase [Ignavibacteriales bacterium]